MVSGVCPWVASSSYRSAFGRKWRCLKRRKRSARSSGSYSWRRHLPDKRPMLIGSISSLLRGCRPAWASPIALSSHRNRETAKSLTSTAGPSGRPIIRCVFHPDNIHAVESLRPGLEFGALLRCLFRYRAVESQRRQESSLIFLKVHYKSVPISSDIAYWISSGPRALVAEAGLRVVTISASWRTTASGFRRQWRLARAL
jgi:hypothetical protein